MDEALGVARQLQSEHILATLDFLGENVTSLEEASKSRDSYLAALERIQKQGLAATVSIKATQFGLDLSEEACTNNVSALVAIAKPAGNRIEIDMESSAYTDRILRLVCHMHEKFGSCVRAVIQAYLYRSEQDIRRLSEKGIPIRLCKGAYREPSTAAYQQKADVDRNYIRLMKLLLKDGAYPGIASHDEHVIDECLNFVKDKSISPERFEFQMLYGIRRDLQKRLTRDGFRLRLYVPYGDAWYPYFMRRLAERPANVLFIARNLLRG